MLSTPMLLWTIAPKKRLQLIARWQDQIVNGKDRHDIGDVDSQAMATRRSERGFADTPAVRRTYIFEPSGVYEEST